MLSCVLLLVVCKLQLTCLFPLAKTFVEKTLHDTRFVSLPKWYYNIVPMPFSHIALTLFLSRPSPANLTPSLREFRRQSYNYTNCMNAATCWYLRERGKLVSKDWTLFHKLFTTQTWPCLCLLSCIESSSLAANGRTKKSWVGHLFS